MLELLRSAQYEEARARLKAGEGSDADLEAYDVLLSLRDRLRFKDYLGAKRMLEKNAAFVQDYVDLAQIYQGLEALDSDQLETLDSWKNHPQLASEAWCASGLVLIRSGRKEEAREAFNQALALDKGHYRALTNLGNLLHEEGQLEEAIATYLRSLEMNPDFAGTHHNLAAAYRKQKKLDKSVYHLKRSQQLTLRPAFAGRNAQSPSGGSSNYPATSGGLGFLRRWWVWVVLILLAWWFLRS